MKASHFLKHYERIANTPDAVPRLRRLILDLAVRGKLVSQDPIEEPASGLLDQIVVQRARMTRTRTPPTESNTNVHSILAKFDLPTGWQFARMDDVIKFWNGYAFKSGDFRSFGVPIIRIGNLQGGHVVLSDLVYLDQDLAQLVDAPFWIPQNALLIAMSGATTGKTAFNRTGKPLLMNQRVGRIEIFLMNVTFVRYFFETIVAHNLSISSGTAIPNLSTRQINETILPVPPLAEQHRIVAKVDELMALCDELAEARAAREATRDRFTAANYARLSVLDPDPMVFADHASFALQALNVLTTRPDQIKQLRQTILNLAVRGKLVPQDPNDEPASELLKRITVSRERLICAGKLKRIKETRDSAVSENASSQDISNIPTGWGCTTLGVIYDVRDGTHDTPRYVERGYPLITSKNLSSGSLSFDDVKFISEHDHRKIWERSRVDKGDVLLAMIGSIGNPVVVASDDPFSIKNVALFKYFSPELSCPSYLRYFLQNAADKMKKLAAGGLQPFVSLGFLRNYPMALPPLSEQQRIVKKVDELMALCDQLEASLATGEDTRRRLLEALIADALKPAAHIAIDEVPLDQEPVLIPR